MLQPNLSELMAEFDWTSLCKARRNVWCWCLCRKRSPLGGGCTPGGRGGCQTPVPDLRRGAQWAWVPPVPGPHLRLAQAVWFLTRNSHPALKRALSAGALPWTSGMSWAPEPLLVDGSLSEIQELFRVLCLNHDHVLPWWMLVLRVVIFGYMQPGLLQIVLLWLPFNWVPARWWIVQRGVLHLKSCCRTEGKVGAVPCVRWG